VQVVAICLPGGDQFPTDPNREWQIGKTISVQVSDFAASNPKEKNPPANAPLL
jgi:hypothetical protein